MRNFLIISIVLLTYSFADIQLIKKENSDSNTTLLVIGGIHGDEPGGYFAAALLATHYNITSKNLWIIPNLNKDSIIVNNRGINGDMNRKFSSVAKKDRDKPIVDEVKKIILSKKVSLVLNLHDGHGFYRQKDNGSIFNPTAWGQTCVIDQCNLKQDQPFGNLNNIALTVKNNVNKQLLKEHHSFNVKNTNTKYRDEEMQLSLTYFAVTNNKPAFAIETSKNLSSLAQKVFYQLLAIEEYMKIMGITYERTFNLNEKSIAKIIKNYGSLNINNTILLNLCDIKNSLSFIPIKSESNEFNFSHPLGVIKRVRGEFVVYIGNKKITKLRPQYFKLSSSCSEKFPVEVDGKPFKLEKATEFYVNDDFRVIKSNDYRVNVIGFHAKNKVDESGVKMSLRDLGPQFSLDKHNKVYRVEFYKNDEFCSMLMVHFK